jgi:hypothetical protein
MAIVVNGVDVPWVISTCFQCSTGELNTANNEFVGPFHQATVRARQHHTSDAHAVTTKIVIM